MANLDRVIILRSYEQQTLTIASDAFPRFDDSYTLDPKPPARIDKRIWALLQQGEEIGTLEISTGEVDSITLSRSYLVAWRADVSVGIAIQEPGAVIGSTFQVQQRTELVDENSTLGGTPIIWRVIGVTEVEGRRRFLQLQVEGLAINPSE